MRRIVAILLCITALTFMYGCSKVKIEKKSEAKQALQYDLTSVHQVSGRQGVCTESLDS